MSGNVASQPLFQDEFQGLLPFVAWSVRFHRLLLAGFTLAPLGWPTARQWVLRCVSVLVAAIPRYA